LFITKHAKKIQVDIQDKDIQKYYCEVNILNPNKKQIIFISYSWDSIEHKNRVKYFVNKLRNSGFEVIYDNDMKLGDRITHFMEEAVAKSDFVFYICTPNYKKKADKRIDGVGYENTIITGDLYMTQNERKFIPVLFSGSWKESTPTWARGKLGIDLTDSKNYDEEYNKLFALFSSSPRNITKIVANYKKILSEKFLLTLIIIVVTITIIFSRIQLESPSNTGYFSQDEMPVPFPIVEQDDIDFTLYHEEDESMSFFVLELEELELGPFYRAFVKTIHHDMPRIIFVIEGFIVVDEFNVQRRRTNVHSLRIVNLDGTLVQ